VIESSMTRLFSLNTGPWGKVQSLHSLFPQSPVRKRLGYRVEGEEVPGYQGIMPGLGGSNTGLGGK
jgi:hypothetical protein